MACERENSSSVGPFPGLFAARPDLMVPVLLLGICRRCYNDANSAATFGFRLRLREWMRSERS